MANVDKRTKELSDVKCVIRALLLVNNGPTRYLSLLRDYRAQAGHAIPYRKFDFSDCLSFLESLTDTVDVSRSGNDVFLRAKVEDNVRHVQTLVQAQKVREHCPAKTSPKPATLARRSAPQLPEFVENNLLQLVGEGVQAHVLCDAYSHRFGMSLDVQRYGFASLDDCLARLRSQVAAEAGLREGVVEVLEHHPEGVFMSRFAEAYARQLGRPPALGTVRLVRRWPELFRVERPREPGDLVLLAATETAGHEPTVPPAPPLPPESSVRVTHVRSPAELAVQPNDGGGALEALTVAMSRFYGPAPSGPFRPTAGRFCAAFCAYWWRRARVAEDCLPGDDVVEVDLLDVGGRQSVSRRQLRPLLPRFAELPAQCVQAALALPPGAVAWKKLAGERLRELTAEGRALRCRLLRPPSAQEEACVQLEDDERGRSLAELLASEGLCESAVRRITLSTGASLHVVRVGARRYILSGDLSRLLGWPADESAVRELERRGILFEVLRLQRERDWQHWPAVGPLVGEGVHTVSLFPADNVVDALNVLSYSRKDLTAEVRLRLSSVDADNPQ